MKRLFLSVLLILGASTARAFDVPAFQKNVVDHTDTLTPAEVGQLNAEIESVRNQSHIFAAVLMIPSLNGEAIESVAEKVFREWKLGQKGTDNGLLFLVAKSDRKMKIETGYGLEGSIPDARARQIIEHILKPKFREEKFAAGLSDALKAANTMVLGGDPIRLKESVVSKTKTIVLVLVWSALIFGLPTLFRFAAVRRARAYSAQLRPTVKESVWWRLIFGRIFLLPIFLFANPGVFFVMFALDDRTWAVSLVFVAIALAALVAMNFEYVDMWTEERREKSFKKLKRRAKGSSSPFDASSSWGSDASSGSSFSSSSSSSDFSSSSGGGSSGGGGASGAW